MEALMNTKLTLVASAFAAALAINSASTAVAQTGSQEKCYGIAKKGKNDCQTAKTSCAGTSTKDKQGDAWIYLPKGTCEKLVGGSLTPKK